MTDVLFLLSWFLSSIFLTQCTTFGNSTAFPAAAMTTTIDNSTMYWGKVYPNYVPLSSDQAGDCNIFGLLCQTGTVTVGVNLTSTTTTTVVPCSSYLSAQANWIAPDGTEYNDYNTGVAVLSWLSSFGRSPECTSFAKAAFPDYAFSSAPAPVLSNCLDNGTDLSTNPQAYLPPGVNNFWGGHYYDCCDYCILNAPQVRVIYFPDPEAPPCQQAGLKNNSISAVASLPITLSGAQKRSGAPVTAVVSGYTFTSPTIYLQVVGIANVSDSCGPRGAQYTNPIIALPSGALSSYSWNVPVGGSFTYQNNFFYADATKAVEVTDLACPSWGFASTTAADGSALVGPPFNPLIEPPQELLSLDPQWLNCAGFEVNGDHLISWAINDPPYALTPESELSPFSISSQPALAPKITSAASVVVSQIPPALPVQTPSNVLQPTSLPPASTSISTPAVVPSSSALADLEPSTNLGQISPNLAEYSFDPSVLYPDSSVSSVAELGQISQNPEHSSTDPSALLATSTASFATTTGLNLGAIIYSAFGGAPTTTVTDPNTNTESVVITVGGVVLTANPSLISLANTMITEGGPAGTVGGTAISIGQSGVVFGSSIITFPTPTSVITNSGKSMPAGISFTANADSSTTIDGSTLVIGSNVATASGEVFTVGGELISANPTALVVAGSTLTAGDPAITVAGTPISLGLSSFAVIGGSSINLDPPSYSIFAIKGQTFTANPSALVVAGLTLTPGGAAITVAGVPISLAPSDIAVIGSSTINLDPPGSLLVFTAAGQTFTANPSAISIDGTTITAGGSGVVVSGTPVSIESGGTLLLGTSVVDLNSLATEAMGGTGVITPFLGLSSQSRVQALGCVKLACVVGLVGLVGLL